MKTTFIRSTTVGLALLLAGLLFCGCENISLSQMAASTGYVTRDQAEAIERTGKAVAKTVEDITPEQEYYIGRAVGATVTAKYNVHDSARATRYINLLGQTLAQASDKPETFGGYHFLILDNEHIHDTTSPTVHYMNIIWW